MATLIVTELNVCPDPCGRVCAPGETACRKHGGNPIACGICGQAACFGHPATPPPLSESREAFERLRAVVERWTYEYHCCSNLELAKHGTGKPTPHSADCPLELARAFLEGRR